MKKYIKFSSFAVLMLFLICCEKKPSCENAAVCMINNTTDTIYYAWNSTMTDIPLPPGDSTCKYVEMNKNQKYAAYFYSNYDNYILDAWECRNDYYIDP